MNKAIFLDRDGVINKVIIKDNKPFSPRTFEEFKLFSDILNPLKYLKKAGFLIFIITNQPDIARGLMKESELNKMHETIKNTLPIDEIVVCPHDDADNCNCRKPKPGMLFYLAEKWKVNLKKSYLIGDTWKDMEAGKTADCITILIDTVYNQDVKCDYRVKDLNEAIKFIC